MKVIIDYQDTKTQGIYFPWFYPNTYNKARRE